VPFCLACGASEKVDVAQERGLMLFEVFARSTLLSRIEALLLDELHFSVSVTLLFSCALLWLHPEKNCAANC
jgi:hypothetical protein